MNLMCSKRIRTKILQVIPPADGEAHVKVKKHNEKSRKKMKLKRKGRGRKPAKEHCRQVSRMKAPNINRPPTWMVMGKKRFATNHSNTNVSLMLEQLVK